MPILLAIASVGVLVALGREALSAFPGSDRAAEATRTSNPPGFLALSSPILAAIGVLVCLFQGAHALLWWMPGSWEVLGDDGQALSLRSVVSFGFAFAIGWIVFDRWRSLRQAKV
ncbi:MAG TPA: hypothetical protein VJL28_00520 [Gemmatimonadaceae bacterium]|nr:hypothetical protein [Gemmatimonadaceae bacterium]